MTRLRDVVGDHSMAELYDAYWVPSALDSFARNLGQRVAKGDRVLDLATGTGLVAGYAASRSGPKGEVVGYDPTPSFLEAARAKSFAGAPISWIEGSAENMPFETSSFDVVLCHQGIASYRSWPTPWSIRRYSFSDFAIQGSRLAQEWASSDLLGYSN